MMKNQAWLWWWCAGIVAWVTSTATGSPLWSGVCTQEPVRTMDFCNTTLTLEERVDDYVRRIPTESMILMMNHEAEGYEPLDIPRYQWWSEGLHGPMEPCVEFGGKCSCPTSFPCPSALGNAFNTSLFEKVGKAVGSEGRAISNLRPHDMEVGDGLTYWSPTINMQRDPRWGRNQEVPGEDPYLTGEYAKAFVQGLQGGEDPSRIQVAGACKHFVANSLEKWGNVTRDDFDAHISEEDLYNYYLPPFRECSKHAVGVMCSYNAVNGAPSCVNSLLLKDLLRSTWGFDGYVVTDCGALSDVTRQHHAAVDEIQASAMALQASVDVNCGSGDYFPKGLLKAYDEGWVDDISVRDAFRRLARVQFRLGMFDPKSYNPEDDIGVVGSNGELALEAAHQSIVLLKNEHETLPLSSSQNLAVVGPHINATSALLSNYHGSKCGCGQDDEDNWDCIETPLQAISRRSSHPVVAVEGCGVADMGQNEISQAVALAKQADFTILLVGLDTSQEREGLDRVQTTLPGLQQQLVDSILDVAAARTIIVAIHGGIVSLGKSVLTRAAAIVSAPYGGEWAAEAMADILFGEYNPTGKLAATVYPPSFVDEMPMTEMSLRAGVGRTHLHYIGDAEYAFGHGLSYTEWMLKWRHKQHVDMSDSTPIRLSISVENLGPYRGSQTVLLFWRVMDRPHERVRQKLISFAGTRNLDIGEVEDVNFDISYRDFEYWSSGHNGWTVSPGLYELAAQAANSQVFMTLRISPKITDLYDAKMQ